MQKTLMTCRARTIGALLAAALTGCAADAPEARPDLILSGLSIINVETGEVAPRQTIIISNGIIQAVKPDDEGDWNDEPDVTRRDFADRFAIPGLWDMHVHIRGGPETIDDNRLWLRQYLGFGVTAVRDAGGDIPENVLAWKHAAANLSLDAPRIFTSLRKVDGSPVFRLGSVEVKNVENARDAILSLRAEGADFIKVNDGQFSDATFLEIVRQADELGFQSSAHIPIGVSVDDLADAGLDSIEHDFYLLRFASADEDRLVEKFLTEDPGDDFFRHFFGMFADFAKTIDDDKAAGNFRVLAENGIAVTPTLYVGKRWHSVDESNALENEAQYFETPASIRESHQGMIEYMNERSPEQAAADLNMIAESQRMVGLAAKLGVMILAGSDTGRGNTFMYPGDSLHHELAALVAAGLSPRDALKAATINAAEWLGVGHEAGAIEAGKWADIVILDENPLTDIANTRTTRAVVRGGAFYDQESLEALKKLPGDYPR